MENYIGEWMRPIFLVACTLAVVLMEGCSMPVDTLIVGHRGASADAPENTLGAFRLAFAQGADWVEGDVRLTKDGEVVCIHDDTTERVTGGQHLFVIEDTGYESLAMLDVGSWKSPEYAHERIPTLKDVIDILPSDKGLLVELKGGRALGEAAARVVRRCTCDKNQVIFISFDAEALRACKTIAPEFEVWLVSGFSNTGSKAEWSPTASELILEAISVGASGIDVHAHKDVVNKAFVSEVLASGLSMNVWTVDDPVYAQQLAVMGVASITTNVPAKMQEYID